MMGTLDTSMAQKSNVEEDLLEDFIARSSDDEETAELIDELDIGVHDPEGT